MGGALVVCGACQRISSKTNCQQHGRNTVRETLLGFSAPLHDLWCTVHKLAATHGECTVTASFTLRSLSRILSAVVYRHLPLGIQVDGAPVIVEGSMGTVCYPSGDIFEGQV